MKAKATDPKQNIAQVIKLVMLLAYILTGLCMYLTMNYAAQQSAQSQASGAAAVALTSIDVLITMLSVGGVSFLGIVLQVLVMSKMIDKTLVERA